MCEFVRKIKQIGRFWLADHSPAVQYGIALALEQGVHGLTGSLLILIEIDSFFTPAPYSYLTSSVNRVLTELVR